MTVTLVAAVARGGVIGRDGGIPWRIPQDMHYKRDEWERYCATVTDWDVTEYLDVLP